MIPFFKKISLDFTVLMGKACLFFASSGNGLGEFGSAITTIDNILNIKDSIDERNSNMYLKANSYLVNIKNEFNN